MLCCWPLFCRGVILMSPPPPAAGACRLTWLGVAGVRVLWSSHQVHQELEKQGKVSGERWLTDDPVPQEGASSALNSNLFASPTAPVDEMAAAPAAAAQ